MKYLIISIKFIFFTILLKSNFLSQEEKRIALVIGNSNYEKGVLKNPINDAKLISTTLQALNFEVLLHLDVESSRELKSAISEFGEKRPNYDVGFIFYAGHGIQVEGENYLLPINESYDTKYDVEDYGVSVQKILRFLKTEDKDNINFLVLDACRDNPFESTWSRSAKGNGLAKIPPPSGSLIAFSTDAGNTAEDGTGINSTYAQSLAQNMMKEDISIEQVFKNTRTEVLAATNNRQSPVESSKLTGTTFYLNKTFNIYNSSYSEIVSRYETMIANNKFGEGLEMLNSYANYLKDKNKMSDESDVRLIIINDYFFSNENSKSIKYFNDFQFFQNASIVDTNIIDFQENTFEIFIKNLNYFIFDYDEKINSQIPNTTILNFLGLFKYTYNLYRSNLLNMYGFSISKKLDNIDIETLYDFAKKRYNFKNNEKSSLDYFYENKFKYFSKRSGNIKMLSDKILIDYDTLLNISRNYNFNFISSFYYNLTNINETIEIIINNKLDESYLNSLKIYFKNETLKSGIVNNLSVSYNDLLMNDMSVSRINIDAVLSSYKIVNEEYLNFLKTDNFSFKDSSNYSNFYMDNWNWLFFSYYKILFSNFETIKKHNSNFINYSKYFYRFLQKIKNQVELILITKDKEVREKLFTDYLTFAKSTKFRLSYYKTSEYYEFNDLIDTLKLMDFYTDLEKGMNYHLICNDILNNTKIISKNYLNDCLKNQQNSGVLGKNPTILELKYMTVENYFINTNIMNSQKNNYHKKLINLEKELKIDDYINSNLIDFNDYINLNGTLGDGLLYEIDFFQNFEHLTKIINLYESENESQYFIKFLILKLKILVTKHCESFKWDIPDIISDVSDIISFCKTNSSYILRMNTTTEMSEFSDLINTKYTGLYSEDEISNFKKELEELLN